MNNYRKKLDEMHAPQSLITATLNRIHEEEMQMEQNGGAQQGDALETGDKVVQLPQEDCVAAENIVLQLKDNSRRRMKRNGWIGGIGVVAAAAVLFLLVGVNGADNGRMELIYNTVPETIVRSALGEQTESDVDVDTFNAYLGVDITRPVENAKLVKSELYMEYNGDKVVADEACVYYNVNGEQLMIRYSKTLDVVPGQLESGEASEVNGLKILAGVSENEKERVAAFERDGIRYFIMSNSMDQKTFEAFLYEFLENE